MLSRARDIDENIFYGSHFVKSKMADILNLGQMEALFF